MWIHGLQNVKTTEVCSQSTVSMQALYSPYIRVYTCPHVDTHVYATGRRVIGDRLQEFAQQPRKALGVRTLIELLGCIASGMSTHMSMHTSMRTSMRTSTHTCLSLLRAAWVWQASTRKAVKSTGVCFSKSLCRSIRRAA